MFMFSTSWFARGAWMLPDGSDCTLWVAYYSFGKGKLVLYQEDYSIYDGKMHTGGFKEEYPQTTPAKALTILEEKLPIRYWQVNAIHDPMDYLCDKCNKPHWQCGQEKLVKERK